MPAEAGIQTLAKHWVPASAGTSGTEFQPRLSSGAARINVQNTLYFDFGE